MEKGKYILLLIYFVANTFCTKAQMVGTPTMIFSNGSTPPPTNPLGTGTLSGKTCFDIALSNDNLNNCATLTSRLPTQSDFTLSSTYSQTYTFTPSGTVSNVRFVFVNTNGLVISSMSGGNSGNNITGAVTATALYNTSLNSLAYGLTNNNPLTVDIYAIYNDGATNNGTDRQIVITAKVKDCACCGAYGFTSTTKNQPSTNTNEWLDFMCYNLGAENSGLDPFSYNSGSINGDLYQWGRKTDGHQLRNSTPLNGQSSTTTPNNAYFYYGTGLAFGGDWLSSPQSTIWGDGTSNMKQTKGVNDPCPSGYKVPSQLQWGSIFYGGTFTSEKPFMATANTWSWSGYGFKVGQLLYLPATGYRDYGTANITEVGTGGYYWSSTVYTGSSAYDVYFTSTYLYNTVYEPKAKGFSVRCISE